jgi:hypothetical protein
MTIKKVGPVSCAKIAGVIYSALGFLVGALVSIFAVLRVALGSQRGVTENAMSPIASAVMGVGAIVILPILYGAIGFLFALIGAWLYNLIASRMGGIEIDLA